MYGPAGELAEALAVHLLRRASIPAEPRIDVHALAAALGAHVAEIEDIVASGRMVPQAQGRVLILLNAHEPHERRAYTLAHELAHLALLAPAIGGQPAADAMAAFTSEETLCDAVAAALLMPSDWVRDRFGRCPRTLGDEPRVLRTIRALAGEAGVSLSAALVRLREVLGWRMTILHWQLESGRWQLVGEAGVFPEQQGAVRSTEMTGWELMRCSSGGSRPMVTTLPVSMRNAETHLPAEVNVRWNSAVAVVGLPDLRRTP